MVKSVRRRTGRRRTDRRRAGRRRTGRRRNKGRSLHGGHALPVPPEQPRRRPGTPGVPFGVLTRSLRWYLGRVFSQDTINSWTSYPTTQHKGRASPMIKPSEPFFNLPLSTDMSLYDYNVQFRPLFSDPEFTPLYIGESAPGPGIEEGTPAQKKLMHAWKVGSYVARGVPRPEHPWGILWVCEKCNTEQFVPEGEQPRYTVVDYNEVIECPEASGASEASEAYKASLDGDAF